jgi:hypothetical protein
MLLLAMLAGMGGCVSAPQPEAGAIRLAAPAAGGRAADEESAVTTRTFLVRGPKFAIGQAASLLVCVTPDGAISRVELQRSSGEASFDEFAMIWARQADVSGWVRKQERRESCGSVRVEIGHGSPRRFGQGADTALG